MPLFGRSYFGLVFLSGGVTESAGSGIRDNYPSGTNFVSNGQRNSTAEVRFDGAPISAPEQGEGGNSNVYYTPSVEVIQEFKVENNSFSAEYGNNGGTVINIMMRQGGNRIHGSGWYFGQRDAFNANDFFSNQAGHSKPPLTHDQYGGMISGPIKKNKTFFLFDFEKLRDIGSVQAVGTVPTDLQRSGDFSQTRTFDENGNLAPVTIYNPFSVDADGTRQPLPGQQHSGEHDRSGRQETSGLFPAAERCRAMRAPTTTTTGRTFSPALRRISSTPSWITSSTTTIAWRLRYSRLHSIQPDPSHIRGRCLPLQDRRAQRGHGLHAGPSRRDIVYTGRLGMDLAIAPGITSYPDLTKAGFPSYMINNGLARMPIDRVRLRLQQPLRPVLRGYAFRAHAATLTHPDSPGSKGSHS